MTFLNLHLFKKYITSVKKYTPINLKTQRASMMVLKEVIEVYREKSLIKVDPLASYRFFFCVFLNYSYFKKKIASVIIRNQFKSNFSSPNLDILLFIFHFWQVSFLQFYMRQKKAFFQLLMLNKNVWKSGKR